ncbi:MAG: abortive infection family protein [Candidatus ainarchaeum sp.]|nr:abortive infection family protein [Candidatus ainarchaeum sp.]
MTIITDLFSSRKKSSKTVLALNTIAENPRKTVIYSFLESVIIESSSKVDEMLRLEYLIKKNKGLFVLIKNPTKDQRLDLIEYLTTCSTEDFLDAIEIFLKIKIENINSYVSRGYTPYPKSILESCLKKRNIFVSEFNDIMKLNSIIYRIKDSRIIAIDSELQYKQLIEPTFALLYEERFKLANEEFVRALENYRKGDNDGAIREANNAFESTIKVVTGRDGDATQLLQECKRQGIISPEYEKIGTHLDKLFQTLPAMRNTKSDAHGQGKEKRVIPPRDALLALNLAATFISYIGSHKKN